MATVRHHPLFAPLTFEPFEIDYEELGPDTPQRKAKRRRIVSNADQYLRGSPLFIQSAALRGPFETGWRNPWAQKKPAHPAPSSRTAHSAAPRHRQTTRDPSLSPEPANQERPANKEPNRAPRSNRTAANTNPRQRERQARAEADHFEQEKRKAKAQRREQRRQELKKREERAAELRKDHCGNSPARPVDLTGASASFNTRLTAEVLGDSHQVAIDAAEEEIARNRDYGSREIRSSFTDEWLNRLRSPAQTPELSPVRVSESGKQVDVLEALSPTRRPAKRPDVDSNGAIDSSRPDAKFLSERQRFAVPESRHPRRKDRRKAASASFQADDEVTEEDVVFRNPSAAPSSSFTRPQDLLSLKQRADGTKERRYRPAKKDSKFSKLALAETGMHSASKVELNEGSSRRKPSSSSQERMDGVQRNVSHTARRRGFELASAPGPENPSSRPAHQQHKKHPSGFTPINKRFSSPPAEPSQPAASTTPAGRPVLGVKAATNNANPAELTSASLDPNNGGVLVMSAGDIRLDNEPLHMFSGHLEGQENNFRNDENKVSGQSPLKEVAVRSPEQGATSASTKSRKRRRDHPLHASPTAMNSPGFAYRKVSDPMTNVPRLQPMNQSSIEVETRKKKRARLMMFGSLSPQPVEATKLEPENQITLYEDQPTITDEARKEQTDTVAGSQVAKADEHSPVRDLSTQAAILFAQREFQHEFQSPLRNVAAASPEKVASSQQTRTSTPPPSQPPAEYTAITPFKAFNKGKPFLTEHLSQPGPAQMSTQELFNAATPVTFSTVKKDKNTQKRVSLAASPLKSAGGPEPEADDRSGDIATPPTGVEGDTTTAAGGVTFGEISTTPPTPKFPGFAKGGAAAPASGPRPHSLNPALSSALKIRNPSLTAAARRTSSQGSSSFSRQSAQPPPPPPPSSSAPVVRSALRQEYRRNLSQGRSPSSQRQRSSQQQQAQQRQPAPLDDVDLDSAMDAADSFLDTAKLGIEWKGSAGRSGVARRV
ncbi:vacuolar protein sorting-associated protein 11 like [Diplodia corticola]|uniref:Vacuolar protein sorting-associated protein 11 like n=1 Tax=Diplodia corticola TaxID=236234 RepID=A0A1J9RAQ6_9PEZI|nr:vacuolar protein sorting-associated protein 11 like [Diplodia corticola]OJD38686.1 vacuolar protein sorting-associated protein 11 like [Diplodia corticola]